MSKFSGTKRRPRRTNRTAPVATARQRRHTREGGEAVLRDLELELFLLAVTIMAGGDTFDQRADTRDAQLVDLVHAAMASTAAFKAGADVESGTVGLAHHLRESMLVRTAPWPTASR